MVEIINDMNMENDINFYKEELSRQNEINRLVIKASRRCVRDLGHALNDIPSDCIFRESYVERYKMWMETFWDTADYRDSLHATIDCLELDVSKLEKLCRDNGIEPYGVPF